MKQVQVIMGMPITLWLPGYTGGSILTEAFDFFRYTDELFSTYKETSQISRINRGELKAAEASKDVQDVLALCQEMTTKTHGYFDIRHKGRIDPSGLVKGWAIKRVGELLDNADVQDYSIDAGGDMLLKGKNAEGNVWSVGIRLPSDPKLIARELRLSNCAVATSGTYERGNHIYNPHTRRPAIELASVTVVGPDICLSDVYATTLFAMGKGYQANITSILPKKYEAYIIEKDMTAQFTPGFEKLVA